MPELPEAEVVRRQLHAAVVGSTIDHIWIGREDIIRQGIESRSWYAGARVVEVQRHGKSVALVCERGGGYELVAAVLPDRPIVGVVHVTITPLDAESGDPVPDARVDVVAYDEAGDARYRARAVNTPIAPRYYDANFTIESEGDWTLVVDVQSERLGPATFNVPLSVGAQTYEPGLGGLLIWLLVIAAFVGGGLYVWYSSVRARRG